MKNITEYRTWLKKKEIKSPEETTKQVCCVGKQKADAGSAEPRIAKKWLSELLGISTSWASKQTPDGVCIKVRHVLKRFASSTLKTLQHAPADGCSLRAWALRGLVDASELCWLVWGTKRLGCHFERSGLGFFILALISSLVGREMLGEIRIPIHLLQDSEGAT